MFQNIPQDAQSLKEFWRSHQESLSSFLAVVLFFVVAVLFYFCQEPEVFQNNIVMIIYFVSVTITTVGYGDICPRTQLGRAGTILIILLGIYLVFNAINSLLAPYLVHVRETVELKQSTLSILNAKAEIERMRSRHHKQYLKLLLICIYWFTVWSMLYWFVGVNYFDKSLEYSFVHALYFCVVTGTTVGYGGIYPSSGVIIYDNSTKNQSQSAAYSQIKFSQISFILPVLFVFFTVIFWSTTLGAFSDIAIERAAMESRCTALSQPFDFKMLNELDQDGDGVNFVNFLGAMLSQTLPGFNTQRDLLPWTEQFNQLLVDGSHKVTRIDFLIQRVREVRKAQIMAIQIEDKKQRIPRPTESSSVFWKEIARSRESSYVGAATCTMTEKTSLLDKYAETYEPYTGEI